MFFKVENKELCYFLACGNLNHIRFNLKFEIKGTLY